VPLMETLKRVLLPNASNDPYAPYHSHYEIVDARGEVFASGGVPVIFFEDGPALAKQALLARQEPARGWRIRRRR